jgi:uncharacterized protein with PIN domain
MRFIADSMLGRLAKWLRLLGYDTLYYPHIENRLLLKIAREDNRILLTKDTRLVKVRGLEKFLLLQDNNPFNQLRTVITSFNLPVQNMLLTSREQPLLSRCIVCNANLNDVSRDTVKDSVPVYVYQTSHKFRKCSGCGKIYWDGTHPGKFREKLAEVIRGQT